MDPKTLKEIRFVCNDSAAITYYKDRYAIDQISALGQGAIPVKEVKKHYGRYLQKPVVKALLREAKGGLIGKQQIDNLLPAEYQSFERRFAKWGEMPQHNWKNGYYQTSRSGYSLVLQLNFTSQHLVDYYKYIRTRRCGFGCFNHYLHPVSHSKSITMAWSRIDVDFDTNEALIEEVQSDWFRFLADYANRRLHTRPDAYAGQYIQEGKSRVGLYQKTTRPYQKIWPEAMLHTTVQFIRQELGIKRIWMHSHETGRVFKEIYHDPPPISLYTKLPKAYGFKPTHHEPLFLQREDYLKRYFRKTRHAKWFLLPEA